MMDDWVQAILIGIILGAIVGNFSPATSTTPKSPPDGQQKKNKKRALCIGCNYTNAPGMTLYGCVSDAERMASLLRSKDYRAELMTSNVTRLRVLGAIAALISEAAEGDHLVLTFSGHGSYVGDTSGDEKDGRDECLVLEDGQFLIDDDLNALIRTLKPGVIMTILFDCCHSGSQLDFTFAYQTGRIGNLVMHKQASSKHATHAQVVYLGACRDDQLAADTVNASGTPTGALTEPVLVTLHKNPNASCYEVLNEATKYCQTNGYSQRPQLSSLGDLAVGNVPFIA